MNYVPVRRLYDTHHIVVNPHNDKHNVRVVEGILIIFLFNFYYKRNGFCQPSKLVTNYSNSDHINKLCIYLESWWLRY